MTLETVPEAMKRNRRAELFARLARLPTPDAQAALRSALEHLARFHGRTIRQGALIELLRVSGATRPLDLLEAMTRYGFFDPIGGAKFAVYLEPPILCVVKPPLSPTTIHRRFMSALSALIEHRLEHLKNNPAALKAECSRLKIGGTT